MEYGYQYNDKCIKITPKSFICDLPANAFLLKIKYPTGFSSCTKCMIVGKTIGRKRTFRDQSAGLKTDESFRKREDVNHHQTSNPIF